MTEETYEQSGPGPYEDAELNKPYRALKLQSNAVAVDLVVKSGAYILNKNEPSPDQPLHLEPGELMTGPAIIQSGTLTGVKGYIP